MELSDKEILRISKLTSDISLLGLELEFEATEVEAFEEKNNADPSKRKGTYDMLKRWHAKDGATRVKLVKALKDSDMGKLAKRVENGILEEKSDPITEAAGKSTNDDDSEEAGSAPSAIDDDTLRSIGKSICTNLDELGGALGFSFADMQKFKKTNYKTDEVTADGTINMLFKWREGVHSSEQKEQLSEALTKAKLIRIQEQFLS